jgi:hypothetical protein
MALKYVSSLVKRMMRSRFEKNIVNMVGNYSKGMGKYFSNDLTMLRIYLHYIFFDKKNI